MPRKVCENHPFFAVGQQLFPDSEDESEPLAGGDPQLSYLLAYSLERSKEAAANKWVASLDLPEEERSFLVDSGASFHMIDQNLINKSEQKTICKLPKAFPVQAANEWFLFPRKCRFSLKHSMCTFGQAFLEMRLQCCLWTFLLPRTDSISLGNVASNLLCLKMDVI